MPAIGVFLAVICVIAIYSTGVWTGYLLFSREMEWEEEGDDFPVPSRRFGRR